MTAPKNLRGVEFGRLTAVEPVGKSKYGRVIWSCLCSCGTRIDIPSMYLLAKDGTRSCGCLRKKESVVRETDSSRIGRRFGRLTVVGRTSATCGGHPVYSCSCDCGNTKKVSWNNLAANRTKSCGCIRIRTLSDGRRGTLRALAAEHGISESALRHRRNVCGMTTETALSVRVGDLRYRFEELDGVMQRLADIARAHGLSLQTVSNRMKRGASLLTALTEPRRTWKRNEASAGAPKILPVEIWRLGADILRRLGPTSAR